MSTHPLPRRYTPLDTVDRESSGELAGALREAVRGEVRFDAGSRGAYSTDASNYRQVPLGVVVPAEVDDVVRAVSVCRHHHVPITSRGGGTSLAGQSINTGVVLDFSKYLDGVSWIDPERRLAGVEPGCTLDDLRDAASVHGLTFGPDPATHDRNTLGGMIGNNSCGSHSVMSALYGPGPLTADQVVELDVLTYDGHRMQVGALDGEELASIIEEGGRTADIHAALARLVDEHAEKIRSRYPDIPRRVSGYNLDRLLPENGFDVAKALVGTEGTCVVVLGATVRLIEERAERVLVVVGYPDVYRAADEVADIVERHRPVACEGLDSKLVRSMRLKGLHPDDVELLPPGDAWLLVEFGATDRGDADRAARALVDEMSSRDDVAVELIEDPWEKQKVWEVRESGLGATANVPTMHRTHPGWEDSAVPPERLGGYLRRLRALLDEFGYDASFYGHFGQGCLHCRIDFDIASTLGVDLWMRFLDRAADLVVESGGSLSGEHGDGQARASLLEKMYGPELVDAFRTFKTAFDPDGMMNPGKVVDPHRPDQDLREGPDVQPVEVRTHFGFPGDHGSFRKATERCVGIGKCRDVGSGTMCPSYMATREELDSTRGRARLLFEMLREGPVQDRWRSDAVRESLDLCLACKACRTECPVNVDMATYKAEFLSHHYAGRLRPRDAYAIGLIHWWARVASRAPGLVNAVTAAPGVSQLVKWAGGVAPARRIPRFAAETFTSWFRRRASSAPGVEGSEEGSLVDPADVPRFQEDTYSGEAGGEPQRINPQQALPPIRTDEVVLWPDTFNNHLTPGPARAAVEVLERAGYSVAVPSAPLCCGRPLYDFGMLDTAKRLWRRTLAELRPYVSRGVPIVGIEPSCVAAFRDELPNLFPSDEDARRLSDATFLLSEFLVRQRAGLPELDRPAIVQGHCQHKAVMHMDAEVAVLGAMGVDAEVLDSGCCGMAGSFGFNREKYEVSMRIGERVLLPRVRDADDDTIVIANGYSCREQIAQATDRRGLHLAEVIALAHRHGPDGPPPRPEDHVDRPSAPRRPSVPTLATMAGVGTLAAAVVRSARTR